MDATYVSRWSAVESVQEWSLTAEGLLVRERTQPPRPPELIPWESVAEVRLSDARSANRSLYRCDLKLRDGRTFSVPSESYVSFATFENQAAEYRAFLAAMLGRLAQRPTPPRFVRGDAMPWRIFQALFVGAAVAGLAWILVVTHGASEPPLWLRFTALIVLLPMFPLAYSQFSANRGGTFDPLNPPAELLPPL